MSNKLSDAIDKKIQKRAEEKKELIKALKVSQVEKEEKFCEICGRLIGTMSDEAYNAGDKICDECGREKDIEEGKQ